MLGMLAAALMQAAATGPSVITNPGWAEKPTGRDLALSYPRAALAANIDGRASIRCEVSNAGGLIKCRVTTEYPTGQGFGDAALAMSAKFKMKPRTRDGAAVAGGVVDIPITFALPQSSATSDPAQPLLTMQAITVTAKLPLVTPANDHTFHYYPDRALAERVQGKVMLRCTIAATGILGDCGIESEEPKDYDFGSTAVQLASKVKTAPHLTDGVPTAFGPVRVPFYFIIPR
ncbi:TonB family protein [Phenylobacterium sp.]|uniref:TonB family protein n=1 Tax=Phenylobacterium sp. TaxID=1871053 RepID=UPI0025F1B582|nr:TonB family protein [Phenylobacterium sp.]